MEKVLQELFWVQFFWAPIQFKRYQNTSGCGTVIDGLVPQTGC